ncbi:acrylyl-CoA reductase (NADPH) [Celerinatantimonas diazotrophica]|uniref:Acrylyl-CoA reductase (NADPH) n=1 Tax=Celerinatantimonas diazotrophica TaxID=412034 RepID=A0A4V2PNK7_9GAMM|nr:MDR family oxidoreductase [Celerinatantimonas diazotrophica]TCK47471.1 acrylyl-CoA reductase (NADPH) [Celerinatantimonas diazotrophica]CAG9296911.1 Acrylyl-CoA reductase AcuI [Celerinatantimonas diazotrophica]
MTFRALVINKTDDHYQCELTQLETDALTDEDVHLKVLYSSLNYKDGLAITGKGPVVRKFPMVPGIDLVAEVIDSRSDEFSAGDQVILNGWGVGEKYWGGLAEYANLRADWLIPLPAKLTPEQAMWIGTAGYTAMLSVMALQQHHITPESGPILVTGAGGGVGSFAVYLLAKLGFKVTAVTGRESLYPYLKELGAVQFMTRSELDKPGKPLQKESWAGAIDCVGSHTLANVCAGMQYGGVVACCGLAQGMDLPASVAPFILRGITLAGIDSVMRPKADRIEAWQQLADLVDEEVLSKIGQTIVLEQALDYAHQLMDGQVKGRIAVKIA